MSLSEHLELGERLWLTPEAVAEMSTPEREERVGDLQRWGFDFIDLVIQEQVIDQGKDLKSVLAAYSGGNDSTTLVHAFRQRITHAGHANTGIGVEKTREFVRQTCKDWGIPLIETHPPEGSDYRSLVLDQGFPGPGHHWKMYQRLKERCFDKMRGEVLTNRRRERMVILAGRRRTESARRANIPTWEKDGSVIWVSPMAFWTKLDLNTYRRLNPDIPRNEVSELIHMSGECLCGAFAKPNELAEISHWFPEVGEHISSLEEEVRATGKHPEWKCQWGWGASQTAIKNMRKSGMSDAEIAKQLERSKSGFACSSCEARQ